MITRVPSCIYRLSIPYLTAIAYGGRSYARLFCEIIALADSQGRDYGRCRMHARKRGTANRVATAKMSSRGSCENDDTLGYELYPSNDTRNCRIDSNRRVQTRQY